MFSNRIVHVATADINIDRTIRQRSGLTSDSVLDLARSIANSQWVSPILIDQESNSIVAGERRLTAVKVLAAAMNGDYSGFTKPDEARAQLAHICTCKVDSWHNWTKAPAQLGTKLTDQELAIYELIENMHRKDLNWQDKAKAIYSVHAHSTATERGWSTVKTAMIIGIDSSHVAKNIKVWRFMEDDTAPEEIVTIITKAETLLSALNNINRYVDRRTDDVVALTTTALAPRPKDPKDISARPGPKAGTRPTSTDLTDILDFPDDETEEEEHEELSVGESLILNEDFHEWAAAYDGPPFNFLHCDFPYGISFNKGSQGSTVASSVTSDYDDSADVYWELLATLAKHQDKLIAQSAHVMFWFSQNLRKETEDFFAEHFPHATIQTHLMIWHRADNSGIIPDSQRYGRRTYETAMLLTFGDRLIAVPRALSFSSPNDTASRIHRSQKPLPVLDHFLSMFIDDASRVLDPTAGSGTSLITAHKLKAETIIGLEYNPEAHVKAVKYINEQLNKEELVL